MRAKYTVRLNGDERAMLWQAVTTGRDAARAIRRAHTLLLADEGHADADIAGILRVSTQTVAATRKRFAREGLPEALYDRPKPGRKRILDAKGEAHLVALACSPAPEGHEVWTMQLLADRLVELGRAAAISDETVRVTLKKTSSSPG